MPKQTPPPAPTLYDLTEELKALRDDLEMWAEENDGDISTYPMERLDKLEGDVKAKVLKCAQLYKEWNAQAKVIAAERKALAAREKAHENRGERIRAYIESCLPPNAKYEDGRSAVSWKNNPPAVEVLIPADQLPKKYQKITIEADKLGLKADMKARTVEVKDGLGQPAYDTEGKPLTREELQVVWPMPNGEKRMVGDGHDEPYEQDVLEDRVIARMVQGRSLSIR
jgi:hypothetical protein